MSSGWDTDIKNYFRKIMRTFGLGLLWMLSVATAGIYFRLGELNDGIRWYNILFYILAIVTFVLLIRQLLKLWNTEDRGQ